MRTRKIDKTTVIISNETVLATSVMEKAYSICGKRIASVPVALMELDHSYQRVLSRNTKKLMEQWNNDKCDFLYVSYRDNKFYIIDGQHRYSVAKAKGIPSLPCIIFTGLTREQEALKFAQQNDNVTKLTAYDTYKANIANGDCSIPTVKIDMEIERICSKYKVIVKKTNNKRPTEKSLMCLTSVKRIIAATTYNGVECFDWILSVINNSNCNTYSKSYDSYIICMLRNYYTENIDNIKIAEVILYSL